MSIFKSYSEFVFYLTSYISFGSSLLYLSILSSKFFQLFSVRKNYLTLSHGILFVIYCCSLLLLFLYLIDGLATHPSVIKPVPPRELIAGKYLVNVIFQANLGTIYDILFFTSFILAWILTVLMLRQYNQRIGKYLFWFLASVPLLFHAIRYEMLLDLGDTVLSSGTANKIPASIGEGIFNSLSNSDIQINAVFFGIPFLLMALKLHDSQLRKVMILTVIGIMLLFGSRDLHSIFVSSVPPGGVVTISFMTIGSYLVSTSLISFLKLVTRDKQLYAYLTNKIEKDNKLFKDLVLSERKILTANMAKPLIDYSFQWQKDHSYEELSVQEVKQIIQEVTSELKERRTKV